MLFENYLIICDFIWNQENHFIFLLWHEISVSTQYKINVQKYTKVYKSIQKISYLEHLFALFICRFHFK